MVRTAAAPSPRAPSSPHTRGDGPGRRDFCQVRIAFSPHTWGWSDQSLATTPRPVVLPTHVGMVRVALAAHAGGHSSPHTRGDGPAVPAAAHWSRRFSPHTWGWSVHVPLRGHSGQVLPIHVGMVRPPGWPRPTIGRSPHTRGDGPNHETDLIERLAFSPHTWGWSEHRAGDSRRGAVLPTHVGMVRSARW